MSVSDVFVGTVAALLGAIILLGGAGNFSWWYQLRKAQWLEERLGRRGARIVFFPGWFGAHRTRDCHRDGVCA